MTWRAADHAVWASAHDGGRWLNRAATTNNLTSECLDSNFSGNIYTLPCNGGNYQDWFGGYFP